MSVGRSWGPWGSLGGLGGSLECLPSVFLGKYKQKTRGHANSTVKTVFLDIRGGLKRDHFLNIKWVFIAKVEIIQKINTVVENTIFNINLQ